MNQFKYGYERGIPVVLVIFNYDEWSGLGTELIPTLKTSVNNSALPKELSAILYLERFARGGKSFYRKESASIIKNTEAHYALDDNRIEALFVSENDWLPCEFGFCNHRFASKFNNNWMSVISVLLFGCKKP